MAGPSGLSGPSILLSVSLAAYPKQVIFIVGATAVGKSQLALHVLANHDGAIINGDSVQFYRGLDIGTAKPTLAEQRQCPHFLFDTRMPDQPMSAAEYRREALAVMEQQLKVRPCFVVGGSGFYLQALEKGVYQAPPLTDEMKRQLAEDRKKLNTQGMHHQLSQADPQAAKKISPNDHYRVDRALGVFRQTKITLTQIQSDFYRQAKPFPYALLKVGLTIERSRLRSLIAQRVNGMMKAGWLEEVQGLIQQGYGDCAPLRSVGYRECVQFLQGKMSRGDLISQIITSTMQLAKRQSTWFRRDPQILWFSAPAEAQRFLSSNIWP